MGAKAIIAIVLLVVIIVVAIANIDTIAMLVEPHAPDQINEVMRDPELANLSNTINTEGEKAFELSREAADEFATEANSTLSDYREQLIEVAPDRDQTVEEMNGLKNETDKFIQDLF